MFMQVSVTNCAFFCKFWMFLILKKVIQFQLLYLFWQKMFFFLQIRDSHFKGFFVYLFGRSLFAFCLILLFLMIFQTFINFRPKMTWNCVTYLGIIQKFFRYFPNVFKDVKLMYKEVWKFRVDACNATDVIQENRWGSDLPPPPGGWRLTEMPAWAGFETALTSVSPETNGWIRPRNTHSIISDTYIEVVLKGNMNTSPIYSVFFSSPASFQ